MDAWVATAGHPAPGHQNMIIYVGRNAMELLTVQDHEQ